MSRENGIIESTTTPVSLVIPGVKEIPTQRAVYIGFQAAFDVNDALKEQRASIAVTAEAINDVNGLIAKLGATGWAASSPSDGIETTLALLAADVPYSTLAQNGYKYWDDEITPPQLRDGFGEIRRVTGDERLSTGVPHGLWRAEPPEPGDPVHLYDHLVPGVPAPDNVKANAILHTGEGVPDTAVAGDYLRIHDDTTNTDTYYIVTMQGKRVELPYEKPGKVFTYMDHASSDQLKSIQSALQKENLDLGRTSQTQAAFMQELAGKLQSMLGMLSNILQRLEHLYVSIAEKL